LFVVAAAAAGCCCFVCFTAFVCCLEYLLFIVCMFLTLKG
jgi:hypothetical protein